MRATPRPTAGAVSFIDPMRASRRVFLGTGAVHNVLDRLSDGLKFTNDALSIRQEASPCVGAIQSCDCQRHAAEVSAKLMRPVLNNFAPKTGLKSSRSCGVPFWTPNKDRSGARHNGEPFAPVEGAVPGKSRNKQPSYRHCPRLEADHGRGVPNVNRRSIFGRFCRGMGTAPPGRSPGAGRLGDDYSRSKILSTSLLESTTSFATPRALRKWPVPPRMPKCATAPAAGNGATPPKMICP